MSSESVWQEHPKLEEELLRIARENPEDVESYSDIKERLEDFMREEDISALAREDNIIAKLSYEAREDEEVSEFQTRLSKAGKAERERERKSVVDEFTNFLSDLIRSGIFEEHSFEDVFEICRDQFSRELEGTEFELDRDDLRAYIREVIWTDKTIQVMEEVVRNHRDVEEFLDHFSWVPEDLAREKADELTGITGKEEGRTPKSTSGFGRLASATEEEVVDPEDFEIPEGSSDNPARVEAEDGDAIAFLNGVQLGVPYGGVIRDNPARRALEDAENRGDSAVVLTNFLGIDVKKAGGATTVYRALTSGRNVNPNRVAKLGQAANAILDQENKGGPVYETTEEMFDDLMRGWKKIAVTPDGDPEFSGPVYIVLGRLEEEFIATAAYWEGSYRTKVRQSELTTDINIAEKALEAAKEGGNPDEIRAKRKALRELQKERNRTIVSNIHPEEWQKFYKRALAYFVWKVEDTIPNSKVIGISDTSIETIHGKSIEISIPSHTRVNDRLLRDYAKNYGPKVLRGQMADAVVICHPYALNYRTTVRECDSEGERGSAEIAVAPIVVDEDYIRDRVGNQVRKMTRIAKSVSDNQFTAGMMRVEFLNDTIMPVNFEVPSLGGEDSEIQFGRRYNSDYIWWMVATDPHFGSPSREPVRIGDGTFRGASEAAMEMLRREGYCSPEDIPLHGFVVNDDPTQGHHFPSEQQPHPKKAPYSEIERYFREKVEEAKEAENREEAIAILKRVQHVAMTQFWRRGETWTQDQMLWAIEQMIEENMDFFDAVLASGIDAGIDIKGISEFNPDIEDFAYDSRDPGLINVGTGNHFEKSVAGELTEGVIFADSLRTRLRAISRWEDKKRLLKEVVRAPLDGNKFIAYGVLQTPEGYEYALDLRSSPPKRMGWADLLRGWVRNDLRRGNYSRIQEVGRTIKICGDKHFFSSVSAPWAFYHMSAPDTPTNVFAEHAGGFPPQNTGVSFIGLPVEGPESAPIITRTLRFDRIRDYFEGENPNFDWDEFLPNSA